MPNLARRLLETFLAFKFPDLSGDLFHFIDQAEYDSAAKTRILRFLNTFSHYGLVPDPQHDPSVLSEARDVLREVLAMVKHLDDDHYERMVKVASA